jgi:hypothetical protein
MRVENTYFKVQIPTCKFYMNYFNLRIIPAKLSNTTQCQATPIAFGSPHEAICAGFVDS